MGRLVKSGARVSVLVPLLALGIGIGTGSTVLLASPAAAAPCIPGVTGQVEAVSNSDPATQAGTAVVGEVLEYIMVVSIPNGACAFSDGTVALTTPDGANHPLATGLSLSPGGSVTYDTNNNVAGDVNVASPFTYTVSGADVGKTNGDPGGSSLPA